MGTLKDTYKGYEIWHFEEGEKTSQPVWMAVSKGKRLEINEFKKTKKAIKKLINDTINAPPFKQETYKTVDIMFSPKTGYYMAEIGKKKRKSEEIKDLRNWIDKNKGKD